MSDAPCILIVEDDVSIQETLEMVLTDEGYNVVGADNGAVALSLVAEYRPAVIVLDLRMPVMNGETFVQTYHQQPGPHAPIIVVTASRDAQKAAAELDVAAVLAKPFDLEELLTVINDIV